MTIKANVGNGPLPILTTDTVIYQPVSIDRYAVTALNIFNTTVASIEVGFWISPDLTTASGTKVGKYFIDLNEEVDINAIIGQGYANENIIALAVGVGLNATITVTQYTEGE